MYRILILFLFVAACSPSAKNEQAQTVTTDTISSFTKVNVNPTDSSKLSHFWLMSSENKLAEKTTSEKQIAIAKWLMETPYVGKTLEVNNTEQLVVNLHELDCTTFLENVTALTMCINEGSESSSEFYTKLQTIRYRNGEINGYPSRLHYFTEWLLDNQKKGLLTIVSNQFGDTDFDATVNFMSNNPQYYKHLSDSANLVIVAQNEKAVSAAKLKLVSQAYVQNIENQVHNGDLIAIATTMEGLDIAHVGIAAHHNGRLHFMHASSVKKKVVLSEKPLSEYLKDVKTSNGILVARIN